MGSVKEENFKRLAQLRANRILHDIKLLGNLSNRNNYSYSDNDVKAIFLAIKEELRATEIKFKNNSQRSVIL